MEKEKRIVYERPVLALLISPKTRGKDCGSGASPTITDVCKVGCVAQNGCDNGAIFGSCSTGSSIAQRPNTF
jgi:hypothetical protein